MDYAIYVARTQKELRVTLTNNQLPFPLISFCPLDGEAFNSSCILGPASLNISTGTFDHCSCYFESVSLLFYADQSSGFGSSSRSSESAGLLSIFAR
jgi:hypothetical protein